MTLRRLCNLQESLDTLNGLHIPPDRLCICLCAPFSLGSSLTISSTPIPGYFSFLKRMLIYVSEYMIIPFLFYLPGEFSQSLLDQALKTKFSLLPFPHLPPNFSCFSFPTAYCRLLYSIYHSIVIIC